MKTNMAKVPRFTSKEGFVTTAKHSSIMKKNKSANTKPELIFRRELWKSGYRYRVNYRGLIGKPDIVFVSRKIAVFIDGDFWHGNNWQLKKLRIFSNRGYWIPKIERNIQRDKEVNNALKDDGWDIVRFWESDILKNIDDCVAQLIRLLKKKEHGA